MSAPRTDCRHVRVQLGGDPQSLAPGVAAHLETCAECRRFREETLVLDARLRAALELPVEGFRKKAPPARRFALAASVLLAVLLGGGFWLLRPPPALAGQVAEHVSHEPGSWEHVERVATADVTAMLSAAGVSFDTTHPIVYAMTCPFNGRQVPHLVVRTDEGPLTVMLLPEEHVSRRREFAEGNLRGVLLPAAGGAVAVVSRDDAVPRKVAGEIAGGVSFR
jgi:hypothetical protein